MSFPTLVVLCALSFSGAAQSVLVSDDFGKATDSLWHFQALAFKEGVLSPGLEAEIPGRNLATGQLGIDPIGSTLRFTPRRSGKLHRSCFLAFRNDFRMDSAFASRVRVEISDRLADQAAGDSLGGLHILIRYEADPGYQNFARTVAKVTRPESFDLDTCALIAVRKGDWLNAPLLDKERRSIALSRITGIGLFYISGNTSSASTNSTSPSLLVGGFKARGEMHWPVIPGFIRTGKITAGDTITLKWKFPSALGARFRWFRNETPLPAAQGAAFRFSPSADDARVHVFRAEVLLPNGDILPTRELRVRVEKPAPPVVLRQSGDTTVPEGGNAIFLIKAEGAQPLEYQWHRNGKPIAGARENFYTFVPTSVYEGGEYHCEVVDRLGISVKSRKISLVVKPGPGSEGWLPQSLTLSAKAGVNVSDFYRDDQSIPRTDFKWNFAQAGLQSVFQFRPSWSLQADLLYSRKGVVHGFSDHTSTLSLDYLEVPLLVRLRIGKKWLPKSPLNLLAGGFGAFLVGAEDEVDWDAWKATETAQGFEDWDYGPTLGMSWQVGILSLEWRYSLGLADIRGGSAGTPVMNGALSGMVGFGIFTAQESAR